MTDPYQILGVDYRANEKQIKNAYKKMVKENHPDRFQDPVEIEAANERMTEINAAFDQIMEDRRLGISPQKYAQQTAYYERKKRQEAERASRFRRYSADDYAKYDYAQSSGMDFSFDSQSVRNSIIRGDLAAADSVLNSVHESGRSAEWHYLRGLVYEKRGWLNEAYHEVRAATQIDPGNTEYAETFQNMNRSRSGYMTNEKSGSSKADFCVDCCCNGDSCECCCEAGCECCSASTS